MPVKLIEEVGTKNVTMLTDVDVKFVSLVRHGANQQPFRVLKSEEKGGEPMNKILVVQSILLPEHVDFADLAKKEGLGWLSDAKTDNIREFESYKKVVQVPDEKMNIDSIQMVKLHKDGAWALVGQLAEGHEAKDVLTVGEDLVQKLEALLSNPMDMEVAEVPAPNIAVTFRQVFDKELGSFLDVFYGSLNQTYQNGAARKKMIMNALDAFKSFLSVGLDAMGKEAVKMERMVLVSEADAEKVQNEDGGDTMDMAKLCGTEEFKGAVLGILKAFREEEKAAQDAADAKAAQEAEEKAAADAKAAEEAGEKKEEKSDEPDPTAVAIAEIQKSVKDLADSVKKIQDDLEDPETTAAAKEEGDPDKNEEKDEKPEKKSVYAGMLTKQP